jgi:hypothetical protein
MLVLTSAPALAALPRLRAGHYVGRTGQAKQIAFDARGAPVDLWNVRVQMRLACAGSAALTYDFQLPLVLGVSGRTFWVSGSGTTPKPGQTRKFTFSGKTVRATAATGTIEVRLTIATSAGTRRCASGVVRWTAHLSP